LSSGSGRDVGRRKKTGCRRRIVLTEDLAAEDRRRGGWASSSTGPQPPGGQCGELQYWAHLTSRAGVVGVGYLWILLIQEPPEPAVLYSFPGRGPKTGSRRRIVTKEDLAAEDLGRQASS